MRDTPARPISNSYIVPGGRLVAGEYPGSPPSNPTSALEAKLAGLLGAGVTAFVDLTESHELDPYAPALLALAAERRAEVLHERMSIVDMNVCGPDFMRAVLDRIDGLLAEGHTIYVHCWGGVGRTGMVVGCWLVRQGMTGEAALAEVARLFGTMSPEKVRRHRAWGSPQTREQREVVRRWAEVPA
jgi:protein-tyrosine phosphatase